MKLMPASSARWMIAIDSSWSVLPQAPNIIVPRQSGLTWTPVRPSERYSTLMSAALPRSAVLSRRLQREPLPICSRQRVDGHLCPPTRRTGFLRREHGRGAVAARVRRVTARAAANATMGVAMDAARRRSAARRAHGAAAEPLQVGAKAWFLLSRSSRWTRVTCGWVRLKTCSFREGPWLSDRRGAAPVVLVRAKRPRRARGRASASPGRGARYAAAGSQKLLLGSNVMLCI